MYATLIYIASLLIPYPTVQHFIWPLHWCLLADICNHTWIPECGTENEDDIYDKRLFIDECDMYEYNCDFETDYFAINYSDCFNLPTTPCPPIPTCPSIPTCPDHRFHRMGQKFKFPPTRKLAKKPRSTTKVSLPIHMLRGRRRYSPTWKKKKRKTTKVTVKMSSNKNVKKTSVAKVKPTILKKRVTKSDRKLKKVFKGLIKKPERNKKRDESNDFLE
ncbi:uncharacterized protein LOC124539053 [Vanessa cardui]|uniref:uncharacterized protein LOC124539053 n=1 Tax=Vanessa cardui TaxID=171605 RepID=UPI001F12BFFE|nr:uncharacterized protein LOC124539053 [Vanessa cardui]